MEPTEQGRKPAGSHTATGCGDLDNLAELSLAHAVGQAHGASLADGLRIQRQQVEALKDPASPQALAVLARQLPLLEALFQRFAEDAVAERQPGRRGELLRGALQAQQAYARTFTLVRALAGQTPAPAASERLEGAQVPTDSGRGAVVRLVGSSEGAGGGSGSGAPGDAVWVC